MVCPRKLRDQGGRIGRRVGLAGADDAEVAAVITLVREARWGRRGRCGERRRRDISFERDRAGWVVLSCWICIDDDMVMAHIRLGISD
jgi:hypothetical protein